MTLGLSSSSNTVSDVQVQGILTLLDRLPCKSNLFSLCAALAFIASILVKMYFMVAVANRTAVLIEDVPRRFGARSVLEPVGHLVDRSDGQIWILAEILPGIVFTLPV